MSLPVYYLVEDLNDFGARTGSANAHMAFTNATTCDSPSRFLTFDRRLAYRYNMENLSVVLQQALKDESPTPTPVYLPVTSAHLGKRLAERLNRCSVRSRRGDAVVWKKFADLSSELKARGKDMTFLPMVGDTSNYQRHLTATLDVLTLFISSGLTELCVHTANRQLHRAITKRIRAQKRSHGKRRDRRKPKIRHEAEWTKMDLYLAQCRQKGLHVTWKRDDRKSREGLATYLIETQQM